MKKTLIVMVSTLVLLTMNVKAQNYGFFTNNNGVTFTEKEYNLISNLYYEGYQNIMELSDYEDIFKEKNIVDTNVTTKVYEQKTQIAPFSSAHETTGKILEISKACPTNCVIVIKTKWKSMPKVRSYDVIGARFINTNIIGGSNTVIDKDGSKISSNDETKSLYNGFGASIKLPTGGSSLIISQTFRVSTGGTVYGSYQHATRTISLANSRNYSISSNGLGGVFSFNDGYNSYYDAMGGVDITV